MNRLQRWWDKHVGKKAADDVFVFTYEKEEFVAKDQPKEKFFVTVGYKITNAAIGKQNLEKVIFTRARERWDNVLEQTEGVARNDYTDPQTKKLQAGYIKKDAAGNYDLMMFYENGKEAYTGPCGVRYIQFQENKVWGVQKESESSYLSYDMKDTFPVHKAIFGEAGADILAFSGVTTAKAAPSAVKPE